MEDYEKIVDKYIEELEKGGYDTTHIKLYTGSKESYRDCIVTLAGFMYVHYTVDKIGDDRYGRLLISVNNGEDVKMHSEMYPGQYMVIADSDEHATFTVVPGRIGSAMIEKLQEKEHCEIIDELEDLLTQLNEEKGE